MADTLELPTPPRPPLIVHIGVTGHRPNRLASGMAPYLEEQCRQLIAAIKQIAARAEGLVTYSHEPPLICVVSSLAEGADRIVAEAGLALGAELHCPLPFAAEEYARDFAGEASQMHFRNLLARASVVVELDGKRAEAEAAYESAGRAVIGESDVLIAIWDGDEAAGRGGTAQIVMEAVEQGVPVIWIHASVRTAPRVLTQIEGPEANQQTMDDLPMLLTRRLESRALIGKKRAEH